MKPMKFLDMFSDYTPCKGDLEKLDCLYIRSAEIDYPQGAIFVELETEHGQEQLTLYLRSGEGAAS